MSYSRPPSNVDDMISLKIDNLTYSTSPNTLRRIFEKYGRVGDVYIPRDRFTKVSRGFAFVRFHDKHHAENAMDALDGFMLDGRELRVQMALYSRTRDLHHGRYWRTPPHRQEHQSRSPRIRHHCRSNNRSLSRSPSQGPSPSRPAKSPSCSYDRSPSTSRSRSTRSSKSKSSSESRSSSAATSQSKSRSPSPEGNSKS